MTLVTHFQESNFEMTLCVMLDLLCHIITVYILLVFFLQNEFDPITKIRITISE